MGRRQPSGRRHRHSMERAEAHAAAITQDSGLSRASSIGDVGDPCSAIIRAAHHHRADVVVIGAGEPAPPRNRRGYEDRGLRARTPPRPRGLDAMTDVDILHDHPWPDPKWPPPRAYQSPGRDHQPRTTDRLTSPSLLRTGSTTICSRSWSLSSRWFIAPRLTMYAWTTSSGPSMRLRRFGSSWSTTTQRLVSCWSVGCLRSPTSRWSVLRGPSPRRSQWLGFLGPMSW